MTTPMMRLALLAAAAPLAWISPAQAGPSDAPIVAAGPLQTFVDAANASDRGDCAEALTDLRPLLAGTGVFALPPKLQGAAFDIATGCAYRLGDKDGAYGFALAGTAQPQAASWLWAFRLDYEATHDKADAALVTVQRMARDRVALGSNGALQPFYQLDTLLKKNGDVARRKTLLTVVTQAPFKLPDPFATLDTFRHELASLLFAEGDTAGATALVHAISEPNAVMALSVDAHARAAFPPHYDARETWERDLARVKALSAAHPDLLEGPLQQAGDLRALGRPADALALLQAAAPVGEHPHLYADMADELVWWWDETARSDRALGRYDDAVAAFRAAIALSEAGGFNVSQTINLADLQLRFGHPQDALATVATLDGHDGAMSEYGEIQRRFARGCAEKLLGNGAAAAADLAFVRAHSSPDSLEPADMMLAFGDMDGAAALYRAALADPQRAPAALVALSDYDPPTVAIPPSLSGARLPELKARQDIRAAIERAGGLRRFHIQNDD